MVKAKIDASQSAPFPALSSTTIFSLTIFLSALLLFLIQPIVGKHALPFFGGSTAVWATSLLVFTGLLFSGYAYVYWLSRRSVRSQLLIHGSVLFLGTSYVIVSVLARQSFFPALDWTLDSSLTPVLQVITVLLSAIGIPYFLLSTTSPLLQHWYSVVTKTEPYRLYSISNFASFLALGAYPFVIEPNFRLSSQATYWCALYVLFACLCAVASIVVYRVISSPQFKEEQVLRRERISWRRRIEWMLYCVVPGALLVATTTELTQTIAPIPFLWILPLSLYLISFIFAFRGWGASGWVSGMTILAIVLAYRYLNNDSSVVTAHLLVDAILLFFVSLFCHAQVYRLRPGAHDSSLLYLCTSLGGMVGVLLVTLVAPVVFSKLWDFPLALAVSALVAVALYPAERYIRDEYHQSVSYIRVASVCLVVAVSFGFYMSNLELAYIKSRNFYGAVKITDWSESRDMYSGITLHGAQHLDEARRYEPTTYYIKTSGIGRALGFARARSKAPLRVGVIGLGTGTIAAYCLPKDTFVFYEIDERIERLARVYFSFLAHCPGASVRIGDGRLVLERELKTYEGGAYDVLAVDAFSDDTIPTHLLTAEAFATYAAHVKPGGIVAIHTSNRYLALSPVVARIGKENGFGARIVSDDGGADSDGAASVWVLLSKDSGALASHMFDTSTSSDEEIADAPLWTDDYVNMFAALRLPSLFQWNVSSR